MADRTPPMSCEKASPCNAAQDGVNTQEFLEAAGAATGCASAPTEGVIFYTRPEDLVPEQIDPLLRDAVMTINSSGWVWTGESCQGHPDAASLSDTAWTHNTEPYLRVICARRDLGRALALLVEAGHATIEDNEAGIFTAAQFRIFHNVKHPEWAEFGVYILARNVMERDFGCRVIARFAAAVTGQKREPGC